MRRHDYFQLYLAGRDRVELEFTDWICRGGSVRFAFDQQGEECGSYPLRFFRKYLPHNGYAGFRLENFQMNVKLLRSKSEMPWLCGAA